MFPQHFSFSQNFHSCFYNSIEIYFLIKEIQIYRHMPRNASLCRHNAKFGHHIWRHNSNHIGWNKHQWKGNLSTYLPAKFRFIRWILLLSMARTVSFGMNGRKNPSNDIVRPTDRLTRGFTQLLQTCMNSSYFTYIHPYMTKQISACVLRSPISSIATSKTH